MQFVLMLVTTFFFAFYSKIEKHHIDQEQEDRYDEGFEDENENGDDENDEGPDVEENSVGGYL